MPSNSVVIVDAVRTPIGKRNGGLASVHPADLLGIVQSELVERAGIDPAEVGQVVGGCVSQVGEQSFNITRTAWLAAGLPQSTAATTVDRQCRSSQQATNLATALVGSDVVDAAIACGVEVMSRVPIGANSSKMIGFRCSDPEAVLRSLRDGLAVRGRRVGRREVGGDPRRHRCAVSRRRNGPRLPGRRAALWRRPRHRDRHRAPLTGLSGVLGRNDAERSDNTPSRQWRG